MKPPRIGSAKVIKDYGLLVNFRNGDIRLYDVSRLLENPRFARLRNQTFFRNFQVETGGYALVWNEDIDISEYELWHNGICVTDDDVAGYLERTYP